MDRPVGKLLVDQNGLARYSYHFSVPPGIGTRNEPNLSLEYGSSSPEHGIVGAGWSLSGLSSISVTSISTAVDAQPAIVAQKIALPYRYALDGSELLCVSGTYDAEDATYRIELDAGQVVTGSAKIGFTVKDGTGRTDEYGTTSDSRVVLEDGSISEWKLSNSSDFRGNYIQYNYTQSPMLAEGGEKAIVNDKCVSYITSIGYTGNTGNGQDYAPARWVKFFYEGRTDPVTKSYHGGLSIQAHRLNTIEMGVGPVDNLIPAGCYRFSYKDSVSTGDSLLQSITEYGCKGTPLTPTVFDYSGEDVHTPNTFQQSPSGLMPLYGTHDNYFMLPLNIVGRSYTDLACLVGTIDRGDLGSLSVRTFQAKSDSGDSSSISWSLPEGFDSSVKLAMFHSSVKPVILTADLNRDGRTDLIVVYKDVADGHLYFAVSRATGKGLAEATIYSTGLEWDTNCKFFAIDTNGDGTVDIVQAYSDPSPETGTIWIRTFHSIIQTENGGRVKYSVSDSWNDPAQTKDWMVVRIGYLPGAGLVRIAELSTPGKQNDYEFQVTTFTCDSSHFEQKAFEKLSTIPLLGYDRNEGMSRTVLPCDVNGDGIQDLVLCQVETVARANNGATLNMHYTPFLFDGNGAFLEQLTTSYAVDLVNAPLEASEEMKQPGPGFYVLNLDGSKYPCIAYVYQEYDTMSWKSITGKGNSQGQINKQWQLEVLQGAQRSNLLPTDINGVGRAGFLGYSLSNDVYSVIPIYNTTSNPDMLTMVKNPLGLQHNLRYAPLSTSIYDPGVDPLTYQSSDSLTNTVCISSTSFVVSELEMVNDATINSKPLSVRYTYKYTGGLLSRDGRGWRGFNTVTETNELYGVRKVSTYNQSWPLSGRLDKEEIFGSSHEALIARLSAFPPKWQNDQLELLQVQSNVYDQPQLPNPNNLPVFVVRNLSSTTTTYDANVKQRSFGTANRYVDASTNRISEQTFEIDEVTGNTTSQVWTKYELNAQVPQISALPSAHKVTTNDQNTNFSAFEVGDLSLVRFDYDGKGNLLESKEWVDSANPCFVSTKHVFDIFGNETDTIDSAGLTTHTTFDSEFQSFAIEKSISGTDVNLTSHAVFDPRFKTAIALLETNGALKTVDLDEWGREIQSSVARESSDSDAYTFSSAPYNVGSTDFLRTLQEVKLFPVKETSRTTETSRSGGHFLCRSTSMLSDANRPKSPKIEVVDCLGRITMIAEQDNGVGPVLWQFKDYDTSENLVLEALPCESPNQFDTVPDYSTSKLSLFDALNRPILVSRPSNDDDGTFTVIENKYSNGGGTRDVTLRSCATLETYGTSNTVLETLTQTYVRVQGEQRLSSSTTNAGVSVVTYEHDAVKRIISVTDGGGKAEKRTYNSRGSVTSIDNVYQNPGGKNRPGILREYDNGGQLIKETNAAGESSTFLRDAKGRLKLRQDLDPAGTLLRTTSYVFESAMPECRDLLKSITISRGSNKSTEIQYTYDYDKYGNKTMETMTLTDGRDQQRSYQTLLESDRLKQTTKKTQPDLSSIQYKYSGQTLTSARLISPTTESWDVGVTYSEYSSTGLPAKWSIDGSGSTPAQLTRSSKFNKNGLPIQMSMSEASGAALVDYNLRYDHFDQITAFANQVTNESTNYGYNDHRLISSAGPNGSHSYEYDSSGNLSRRDDMAFQYTPGTSGTESLLVVGSKSQGSDANSQYHCAWDDAGRATSRHVPGGPTQQFTYDGNGKLREVKDDNGTTVLVSDHRCFTVAEYLPNGEIRVRVGKEYSETISPSQVVSRNRFLVGARNQVILSVLSPPQTQEGEPVPPSTQLAVYMTDHKGTITHHFDGRGQVLKRLHYDDWGAVTKVEAAQTKSTDEGELTLEAMPLESTSGLLDFTARMYDPFLARFTTPDTVLEPGQMIHTDGLNRMAFENNDPINHTDPTGHLSINFWAALAVSVLLFAVGVGLAIATGGASAVLTGVLWGTLSGFLIGAGSAGIAAAIKYRDNANDGRFWSAWGAEVGIGAAVGALTGGMGGWLSAGTEAAKAAVSRTAVELLQYSMRDEAVQAANTQLIKEVLGGTAIKLIANPFEAEMNHLADNAVWGTHDHLTAYEAIKGELTAGIAGLGVPVLGKIGGVAWLEFKVGREIAATAETYTQLP